MGRKHLDRLVGGLVTLVNESFDFTNPIITKLQKAQKIQQKTRNKAERETETDRQTDRQIYN